MEFWLNHEIAFWKLDSPGIPASILFINLDSWNISTVVAQTDGKFITAEF